MDDAIKKCGLCTYEVLFNGWHLLFSSGNAEWNDEGLAEESYGRLR